MNKINGAVIGYGYWGPKIARNLYQSYNYNLHTVCDLDEEKRRRAQKDHDIETTEDFKKVLNNKDITSIFIASPVATHYPLAKKAIKAGKNVFIEKPLADTTKKAKELVELAEKKGVTLMVDHIFVFSGAVEKIRELIESGELGEINYIDSTRVNLGLFQHDINVVWDLAPHDLSIIDYLLDGEMPNYYSAEGCNHVDHEEYEHENVAYLIMKYSNNTICHININWLSPVKVRKMLVAGSKKMIVYNDNEPEDKIKVYDKGVEIDKDEELHNLLVTYRSGDYYVPKLDTEEPLRKAVDHFYDCIKEDKTPITDGSSGVRVVQMLEKLDFNLI